MWVQIDRGMIERLGTGAVGHRVQPEGDGLNGLMEGSAGSGPAQVRDSAP